MAKAFIILPPPSLKIDKLDWNILRELDQDASQPLSHIGKKLRSGRDVIAYRVNRLERAGVIRKYVTVIDYFKLGFFMGASYFKLQRDYPELREEIISRFVSDGRVSWLNERDGEYDFAFGWLAKTLPEGKGIGKQVLGNYYPHVKSLCQTLYSKIYLFKRGYLYGKKEENNLSILEARPEKLTDETDERILALISGNARVGHVELARKLGLSPAQVQYRVMKMREKGVILGASVSLGLSLLGYERYKIDFYFDDPSGHDDVVSYSAAHPNSVYGCDSIGGPDLEIEFEARGYGEIKGIEAGIKQRFGDKIRYTGITRSTKEHKPASFAII